LLAREIAAMIFTHHDLEIELNDEWWAAAEMVAFVPVTRSYRVDPTFSKNGASIVEISIADICPVHRSVGIFRDCEDGVPARERVVKILRGFRLGELIPAVEVLESKSCSACKYQLTDGTHRLYCSLAAGFTHVPTVQGFDWTA
jgi:hypothetical protein